MTAVAGGAEDQPRDGVLVADTGEGMGLGIDEGAAGAFAPVSLQVGCAGRFIEAEDGIGVYEGGSGEGGTPGVAVRVAHISGDDRAGDWGEFTRDAGEDGDDGP